MTEEGGGSARGPTPEQIREYERQQEERIRQREDEHKQRQDQRSKSTKRGGRVNL